MFEKKKVVLQADLASVEVQLRRIGDLFETYLTKVCGVDLAATTADMSEEELERFDELTPKQQEWLAAIEQIIEDGGTVSASAYKAIGLEPPNKEDEPTEFEVTRPQPGAEVLEEDAGADDEPTTARREDAP